MAAILDPKTRFFDTFLTKEGRRQLANGEIRTRFISFSDSLTSYEQSELGVINSKDGSVFFEAMSRPQDQIVTENPSIINMMELRNPSAQPSFLVDDEIGPSGSMTNSAMFGKEILVPPDGREILVVTGSGIDRKEVDYDLRSPFYISGSRSQELFYNSKTTGFRGWWSFDESVTQLSEFSEPSYLSFERNLNSPNNRTVTGTDGVAGAALTSRTLVINFSGNIDFTASVGDTIGFKASSGKRIAFRVRVAVAPGDNTPNLQVTYSPSFSLREDQAAANDSDSENESNSDMGMQVGEINTLHFLSANVAQNLSSSSPLSTNAAYMTYDSVSTKNVIDPNPLFEEVSLPLVCDENKSYKTKQDGFIQINLREKHYQTGINWKEDWGSSPGGVDAASEYINQVSTWFYLKEEAFTDGSYPTQTIMQLFRGNSLSFELQSVGPVLRARIHNSATNGIREEQVSNSLDPEKWHRVSVVYGPDSNSNDNSKCFLYVVLDGDRRKSLRISITGNEKVRDVTDLILGNSLSSLNSQPDEGRRLLGYIQECQYFILRADSIKGNFGAERFHLPAYGNSKLNDLYDSFLKDGNLFSDKTKFDSSGQSASNENPGDDQNLLIDNYLRYISEGDNPLPDTGIFVSLSGSILDSRESLREWINYSPIRDEAALYFGALTRTYVKEQQLERGVSRSTVKNIVNRAQSTMSGSLRAYRQLGLLQHLDLETNTGEADSLLEAKRFKVEQIPNGERIKELVDLPLGETGVFKTRVEAFPLVEPIYGQSPNNYERPDVIPQLDNATFSNSPVSGDFLKSAGTVYHLNEIIDNEADGDDLTTSSSRLPNYFLLPPIAADYFSFNHDGEPNTLQDVMAWTDFLRRRGRSSVQDLDAIKNGNMLEEIVSSTRNKETYLDLMKSWYRTLIPRRTLNDIVSSLGIGSNSDSIRDSNVGMIRYLTRDRNESSVNGINYDLNGFSEEIEFTATSESNTSFIQMFEVAKDNGKVTFEKLAIMDLGVINTSKDLNHLYEVGQSTDTLPGSPNEIFGNEIRTDIPNSNFGEKDNNLSHVFAFGKIIDDPSDTTPGAKIYFFPIFTLECKIEV